MKTRKSNRDEECPKHKGHGAYFSQETADRAVALHKFAYPACPAIYTFECGDPSDQHWHIGHPTPAAKAECLKYEPPKTAPRGQGG